MQKSCANCKFLSHAETIIFNGEVPEERVLCMKKKWHRGSVRSDTIYQHPGTFRDRAATCGEFQGLVSHNATAAVDNIYDS